MHWTTPFLILAPITHLTMATRSPNPNFSQYPIGHIHCERHGPLSPPTLIFTHGVDGNCAVDMTRQVVEGYAAESTIVCWNGTRHLRERVADFQTVLAEHNKSNSASGSPRSIAFGGRSMGARAAVVTALEWKGDSPPLSALVLVSWPMWAGSRGERREPERREEVLVRLPASLDVLFVLGTEDAQCPLRPFAELRERMAARSWVVEVVGANHRMEQRPGHANGPMRVMTGKLAAEWVKARDEGRRFGRIEWNGKEKKVDWSGWTVRPGWEDEKGS